jgi:phosphoadenosine phosphosulfate reductase
MPCVLSKSELEAKRNHILNVLLKNKMPLISKNVEQINDRIFWDFRVAQAEEILKSAHQIFGESLVVAFSGGKDSLVALHLALHTVNPEIPVLFSSTTVEFPETIQYVRDLAKEWRLNLFIAKPRESFFTAVRELGWASHENRWCCRPYKEEPAHQFIVKRKIPAEITGITRTESIYRRSLTPVKMPSKEPLLIRINPIYDWNEWEVWKYIRLKKLPYNPLYDKGYRRIGCWCCPINGWTHYRRLQKTHPRLYGFLKNFKPKHPQLQMLAEASKSRAHARAHAH